MIAHAARRLAAAVAALVLLAVTLVAVGPQIPNVPFGPQAVGAQERAGGEPGARENLAPDAAIRERAATAGATRGPGVRAAEDRGPGERAGGDFNQSNTCLEQENNVLFLFEHSSRTYAETTDGAKKLFVQAIDGLVGTNSRVTIAPFSATTPHNNTYQMSGSTQTQARATELKLKISNSLKNSDGQPGNWASAFRWARENAPATGWDSIVFIGSAPPQLSRPGEKGNALSPVNQDDIDRSRGELEALLKDNPGVSFMPITTDYFEYDDNTTIVYGPYRVAQNGALSFEIFGLFAKPYRLLKGLLGAPHVYKDAMGRIKPWCLNVSTELVDGTGQSYDAAEDSTIDIETAPPLKISPGRASAGTFENRIEDPNSTTPLLPNYRQMRTNNQGKVGGHLYATEGKPGRFTLRPQLPEDRRFYADKPMTCRATTVSNADDAGARQTRTREVGTLSKGPRGEPVMTIDSKPGESIECTVRYRQEVPLELTAEVRAGENNPFAQQIDTHEIEAALKCWSSGKKTGAPDIDRVYRGRPVNGKLPLDKVTAGPGEDQVMVPVGTVCEVKSEPTEITDQDGRQIPANAVVRWRVEQGTEANTVNNKVSTEFTVGKEAHLDGPDGARVHLTHDYQFILGYMAVGLEITGLTPAKQAELFATLPGGKIPLQYSCRYVRDASLLPEISGVHPQDVKPLTDIAHLSEGNSSQWDAAGQTWAHLDGPEAFTFLPPMPMGTQCLFQLEDLAGNSPQLDGFTYDLHTFSRACVATQDRREPSQGGFPTIRCHEDGSCFDSSPRIDENNLDMKNPNAVEGTEEGTIVEGNDTTAVKIRINYRPEDVAVPIRHEVAAEPGAFVPADTRFGYTATCRRGEEVTFGPKDVELSASGRAQLDRVARGSECTFEPKGLPEVAGVELGHEQGSLKFTVSEAGGPREHVVKATARPGDKHRLLAGVTLAAVGSAEVAARCTLPDGRVEERIARAAASGEVELGEAPEGSRCVVTSTPEAAAGVTVSSSVTPPAVTIGTSDARVTVTHRGSELEDGRIGIEVRAEGLDRLADPGEADNASATVTLTGDDGQTIVREMPLGGAQVVDLSGAGTRDASGADDTAGKDSATADATAESTDAETGDADSTGADMDGAAEGLDLLNRFLERAAGQGFTVTAEPITLGGQTITPEIEPVQVTAGQTTRVTYRVSEQAATADVDVDLNVGLDLPDGLTPGAREAIVKARLGGELFVPATYQCRRNGAVVKAGSLELRAPGLDATIDRVPVGAECAVAADLVVPEGLDAPADQKGLSRTVSVTDSGARAELEINYPVQAASMTLRKKIDGRGVASLPPSHKFQINYRCTVGGELVKEGTTRLGRFEFPTEENGAVITGVPVGSTCLIEETKESTTLPGTLIEPRWTYTGNRVGDASELEQACDGNGPCHSPRMETHDVTVHVRPSDKELHTEAGGSYGNFQGAFVIWNKVSYPTVRLRLQQHLAGDAREMTQGQTFAYSYRCWDENYRKIWNIPDDRVLTPGEIEFFSRQPVQGTLRATDDGRGDDTAAAPQEIGSVQVPADFTCTVTALPPTRQNDNYWSATFSHPESTHTDPHPPAGSENLPSITFLAEAGSGPNEPDGNAIQVERTAAFPRTPLNVALEMHAGEEFANTPWAKNQKRINWQCAVPWRRGELGPLHGEVQIAPGETKTIQREAPQGAEEGFDRDIPAGSECVVSFNPDDELGAYKDIVNVRSDSSLDTVNERRSRDRDRDRAPGPQGDDRAAPAVTVAEGQHLHHFGLPEADKATLKVITEYSAQKAALSVSKQVENDPAGMAAGPSTGEGDGPSEVNNAGKTLSKAYFGYSAKCTVPRLPQATEPVTEVLTEQDAQKFVLASGQSYRRTELVGAACEVAETELNGAEVTPDKKFAVRLDESNRITRDGGRNFLVAPNVINAQATDPARVGTKVGDSVLISSGPGVSEATNRTFYNTVYRNGIGVRVLMENANGTCVDGATFSVHKAKTDVTFENAPYSERVGEKVAELDGENCDTDGYTADLPPGSYYLVQDKSPKGLQLLAEPWRFDVVGQGGTESPLDVELSEYSKNAGLVRLDKSNSTEDVKLIRVANVQDGVLPLTGGIGVWAVALAGLAVAGAGLFWVRRRL